MSSQITTITTPPLSNDDHKVISDLVKQSGSSFFWAMRLLPRHKRRAMFAIYAFAREVDDIADEPGSEDSKLSRLAEWRREIDRLYQGQPDHMISRALMQPVADFELQKKDFLGLIDGMEMDAGARVRISNLDELFLYCDRVACTVGRLCTQVFGLDQKTGKRLAENLGLALQLTNILRDIIEDAEIDRVYLPTESYAPLGIDPNNAAPEIARDERLAPLCQMLAARTDDYYCEAVRILNESEREKTRPAIIMLAVYRTLFEQLKNQGWPVGGETLAMSKGQKLWIAARYGYLHAHL